MKLRPSIIDGMIIGVTQAIILILLLVLVSAALGNSQEQLLSDIRNATRAQVCVLLLPVNDQGRDEAQTNSRCLVPNGIPPVDANGNGTIEYEKGE